MRIDPRRRARAFTLLEVIVVFLIVALLMVVAVGLISNKVSPKRTVPAISGTKKPMMIERDGSAKTTPAPAGKPEFR